ncbi:MAG TPA: hypothetical protein VGK64_13050 [Bryobacteraceae bacterium]
MLLDLERDIEQGGLSQLSRDAIERLRERVVVREIIVIDSSGKAVRTRRNEPQVVMTGSFLANKGGSILASAKAASSRCGVPSN